MTHQVKITYKQLYIFSLCLYFLALPLGAVNLGVLGSALKIFAVLPIIIALFGSGSFKLKKPILGQLLFTLFATLSVSWSVSMEVSLPRVFTYVQLFLLLISGSFFHFSEKDIQKCKMALVWSSRITVAVVLLFGSYIENRLFLDGVIQEDPNYLCAYFSFGVIAAVQELQLNNPFRKKIVYLAELTAYLYMILSTGSRGGLISILAGVLIYYLTTGERTRKSAVLKITAIFFIFIVLNFLMEYLPEELKIRYTIENVVARGGSGRMEIWTSIIDMYKSAPIARKLFGHGTATIIYSFIKYGYDIRHVAHNIFLETLIELGIIGLIIYICAIFAFLKAAWRNTDKFAFAVVISMVVLSMTISISTFKPYFNIMLYIIATDNRVLRKSLH